MDQAGISGTVGLWKNNYLEGNIGYLHSALRQPRRRHGALHFPVEQQDRLHGGRRRERNACRVGQQGRAVVGVQFGNMMRPKEMLAADHPIPVDVPRVRYEVLTRRIRTGNSPPVADAGPGPDRRSGGNHHAGRLRSYDPDGDPITYQWIQEAGPSVSLSAPTASKTTYTATSGQSYASA